MPHRKCKTVYYFDELCEDAKEIVLNRWREGEHEFTAGGLPA